MSSAGAKARPLRADSWPTRTAAGLLSRVGKLPGMVALLIAVTAVVFYLIFHNGSWVYDDYFVLALAHQHGFDLSWLGTPLYQHWNPAVNATFSLLLHLFPIDYRWGLAVALVGLGAMIWMFSLTFSLITRNRLATVALAIWFAFSILWTPPLQWWMFSVQIFPNIFFDLLCLYAFLRFQAEGGNRWILVSAASIAAGLLFYEKTAFMLLYLVLARCLLMDVPLGLRAQTRAFWRERRLWGAYLLVVGGWGVAYLTTGAYSTGPSGVPLIEYVRYFKIMWSQTLVPLVLGLSVPPVNLSTGQTIGVVVLEILVLTAVAVTILRSPRAARGWLYLVIVVFVGGLVVARSRLAQFGLTVSGDRRYLLDFSWLIPLVAVAVAQRGSILAGGRGPTAVTQASSRTNPGRPQPAVFGLVAVALIAYMGLSTFTAVRLERNWPAVAARHWYQNIQRGLAQYDGHGQNAVFSDNEVAPEIIGSWEDPYSRLSTVLPLYLPDVRVDGPLVGRLLTVSASGAVHPARMAPLHGSPAAYRVSPRPAGATRSGLGCYQTPAGEMILRSITLPSGLGSTTAPVYVVLSYRVPRPVRVAVYLDSGSGLSDVPDELVSLEPGATRTIAWLRYGSLRRFGLQFPAGMPLCLGGIQVVRVS